VSKSGKKFDADLAFNPAAPEGRELEFRVEQSRITRVKETRISSMAAINYQTRRAELKIVYYGPALAGKTTSLQYIHTCMDPELRSDLIRLPTTSADRTLFFDCLPIREVNVKNYGIAFKMWTLPGQPMLKETRKLVLRRADGIVFVADSCFERAAYNIENLIDLRDNLKIESKCLKGFENEPGCEGLIPVPWVLFYNKRDLPDVMPIAYMDAMFDVENRGVARFCGNCMDGENVFRTANTLMHQVVEEAVLANLGGGDARFDPALA
jgi:signal recognition particle receptor subunit beta